MLHCESTNRLTAGCVIRNVLGDDVLCACESGCYVGDALFFVDILCRDLLNGLFIFLSLLKKKICKGFKTALACDGCAGLSVGTVGAVDIVDLGDRLRRVDCGNELFGELALSVDKVLYLLAALCDSAKVGESVKKVTKNSIVKRAGHLFTVTRDKGDGVTLVDKLDGLDHLFFFQVKFLCKDLFDCHLCSPKNNIPFLANCKTAFYN